MYMPVYIFHLYTYMSVHACLYVYVYVVYTYKPLNMCMC